MNAPDEQAIGITASIVLRSLDNIEREIEELRKLLEDKPIVRRSLRGLWRGAEISDEGIDDAKRAWMKHIDEFDND